MTALYFRVAWWLNAFEEEPLAAHTALCAFVVGDVYMITHIIRYLVS